ncbi:CBS domain-containing protein [Candidatus Woesearchaeota archaeon]|nr:CBS domain-containing protein [Candidatus Woesearchaeota archaeon]
MFLKQKKRGILVFMLVLFSLSAFGLPIEPTFFYGQVISQGHPVENIVVTAMWVDQEGKNRTSRAMTLSREYASMLGEPYLYGYYSFTNGTVQAKPNTDIIIKVEGVDGRVVIPANPGNEPILVNPIIINRHQQTLVYQIVGKVRTIIRGKAGPETSEGYYFNIYEDPGSQREVFQTDKEITLEETQKTRLAEVEKAQNESNATYVALSNIEGLSGQEPTYNIESLDDHYVKYQTLKIGEQQEKGKNITAALNVLKLFGVLIVIYIIIRLYPKLHKEFIQKIMQRISLITFDPVINHSRQILNTRIAKISQPLTTVPKELSCAEVLNFFVSKRTDSLLISDSNKCIGSVSETDLLRVKIDENKSLADYKIKELMLEKNHNILAESTVRSAYISFVSNNLPKLCIVSKDTLMGEVTLLDLQQQIKGFSRHFKPHGESGIPTVRDVMDKSFFTLDKNEGADKARQLMVDKELNSIVIVENHKPIGIFTVKDYIIGLSKYQKNLSAQNLASLMSTSIVSIDPELNIFEANDFMVEKTFRRYPVILDDQVIGILNQKQLCEEIFNYLQGDISR